MVRLIVEMGAGGQRLHLSSLWIIAVLCVSAVFVAPILAVFVAASGDSQGLLLFLLKTSLTRYVSSTVILMAGVSALSVVFGVSIAWVIFRYDFPGRQVVEWMLLLPAAVPAYLVAYTYTDFLEYAGPVQGMLRDVFGWQSARDYWFPEIRSMEGGILVMGAVLYPYVYIMARTSFMLTPVSIYETAMLAKHNLFWTAALPLARPAIIAGLAPVLMEVISDFGTSEFFGIPTLTVGIFNVWLGMNNLVAAAQIAVFGFCFIVGLLMLERWARSARRYSDTSRRARMLPPKRVSGWALAVCYATCFIPIIVGFVIPVGVLFNFVLQGYSLSFEPAAVEAARHSIMLASAVALMVISVALLLGTVSFYLGGPMVRRVAPLAAIGYAFPGTILAIGVVTAAGTFDAGFAGLIYVLTGEKSSGLISGTVMMVIIACAVRFQALGYGAVSTGLERLPPNIMNASRSLGNSFGVSLIRLILPLLTKSILAGALLVFVDVMKELPMTLLLRPFNFETLATYVYQYAKDELLEEAALPALLIVATGLGPVIVMNSTLRRLTR